MTHYANSGQERVGGKVGFEVDVKLDDQADVQDLDSLAKKGK